MPTGRETLERIDGSIAELRKQEASLALRIARTTEEIVKLREDEAKAFRELASMRLNAAAGDRLGSKLDAAEAEARKIMEARVRSIAELDQALAEANAEIDRLEAERRKWTAEHEARDKAVDEADAALLKRIAETSDYKNLLTAAAASERIAAEAERKAELAREDRMSKGKPYEADPLFMYLWRRKYGAADYQAWRPIRLLDDWVARLVRYQNARANYHMLTEIPVRLAEHAARTREKAKAAAAAVVAYERQLRVKHGHDALDRKVEEAASELKRIGDALQAATAKRAEIEAKRGALMRGDDSDSRRALDTLASALRYAELSELRRAALMTPEPGDEAIVARIDGIRAEIGGAEEDLANWNKMQRALQSKRLELEKARSDYVGRGYDDNRWEFDGDMTEELLKGVLDGIFTGTVLSDQLRRRGRYSGPYDMGDWRPPQRGGVSLPGGFGGGGFRHRPSGGFRTGGKF